jgi:hypothetical protein
MNAAAAIKRVRYMEASSAQLSVSLNNAMKRVSATVTATRPKELNNLLGSSECNLSHSAIILRNKSS